MRTRLRRSITADYQVVRDNFTWTDHVLRLMVTAGAVAWLKPESVIDPACGDASIVEHAHRLSPILRAELNDLSVPQIALLWGKEFGFKANLGNGDAAAFLESVDSADVVVLTEILEHVEDPDRLVALARAQGKYLVASSPINEEQDVGNHEHVWAWDQLGYRQMLEAGGWKPRAYIEIAFPTPGFPYTYQLWVCE